MYLDQQHPLIIVAVVLLAAWTLVWKGLALWRAAQRGSKPWFIVMLIINTLGILEIIYLFAVAPNRKVVPPAGS